MKPELARTVALVTGQVKPVTDAEREKLRRGDEKLLSVLRSGRTLRGTPIIDKWNGQEPPERPPLPRRQRQVARLVLQGYRIEEAAEQLGIRRGTAYVYAKELRRQTGEQYTWRAALMAAVWGWL